jgi:RNA polymerase sigma factor (sigma-70 family)
MHVDPDQIRRDIDALRAGDDAARDRLCRHLEPVIRRETRRILGDHDQDVDDIVQESMLAGLGYVTGETGFSGDLVRLVVTVARNRCRDVYRLRQSRPHVAIEPMATWLADPSRSPLDELAENERWRILQSALDAIGEICRRLLHALYVEGASPGQVRERIGLETVQGVYHRRSVCLEQVRKLVQRRLRFGSSMGEERRGHPEPKTEERTDDG